ncbi:MAG: ATP-grasp domain-containing protein [Clostridiales bacterium]|nr:ATP-grasp domain-containing protein [Clostridiales bacterium]
MNFVFVSPQFPDCYRHFCQRLKGNGVNVLGIGDCPYALLHPELKASLTEYYKVDTMEDYDQMLRAVAYFTFRYGKIDYLESNNEYWMEQDARLRQDFHITSGLQPEDMRKFKNKSAMKAYYAAAGIPTARYHLLTDRQSALDFAHRVGYPLVAKPDNGVGAAGNRTLRSDEDLYRLFDMDLGSQYILEEFVSGDVSAFDGIVNSKGEIVFCANHVTTISIMDMVQHHGPMYYSVLKDVPWDMLEAGKAVLKSFGLKKRSFHLEFFRLTEAKEGLGNVGDIVGLEVNMRPAGGYTPDMINYATSADYYQLWADMICYDEPRHGYDGQRYYCAYVGRWDEKHYRHSHDDICQRYGWRIKDSGRLTGILEGTMGDDFLIGVADTAEARDEMIGYMLEEY